MKSIIRFATQMTTFELFEEGENDTKENKLFPDSVRIICV